VRSSFRLYVPSKKKKIGPFFLFLLVYINCTKEFHCDISIHVYNGYFDQIHSVTLSYPSSPFKTILVGVIIRFSCTLMKYFNDDIHLPFTLSIPFFSLFFPPTK
jgi:hypothetical protein